MLTAMRLVVGLGNPGRQYQRTPHNVGYDVIEKLAGRHGGAWRLERRFDAETCEIEISGTRLTLMKPLTYMNLSGYSVGTFCQKTGCEPHEVLSISDDTNLPLGKLRLRPSGSHGGHKGLLSIMNSLGSLDFPRLRIGVKPEDREITDRVDFVLRPLKPDERETLLGAGEDAADCIEMIASKGFKAAMNRFNGTGPEPA
jgi:peptidyl-tRNA hydrolase, PTH1 family